MRKREILYYYHRIALQLCFALLDGKSRIFSSLLRRAVRAAFRSICHPTERNLYYARTRARREVKRWRARKFGRGTGGSFSSFGFNGARKKGEIYNGYGEGERKKSRLRDVKDELSSVIVPLELPRDPFMTRLSINRPSPIDRRRS